MVETIEFLTGAAWTRCSALRGVLVVIVAADF